MGDVPFIPVDLVSPDLMVLASTAEATEARTGHLHSTFNHGTASESFPLFSQLGEDGHSTSTYPTLELPHIGPSSGGHLAVINPQGGGAFRPVISDSTSPKEDGHDGNIPPPALHQNMTFDNRVNNIHYSAIASTSVAAKVEETPPEMREQDRNGEADLAERIKASPITPENHEEGRSGLRSRSRKRVHPDPQALCCPVCGVTLRPGEMQSHLVVEADKLDKIYRGRKCNHSNGRDNATPGTSRKVLPSHAANKKGKDGQSNEVHSESRYNSYLRVKAARQTRLSAQARKKKRSQEDTICPVCNEPVLGTPEELNEHVNQCLKKVNHEDSDVNIDVDGEDEEEYEEYTWAGQTRIRATTLLPGGLGASGFTTATKASEDEDVDLDVDGDDSQEYGHQQYGEVDLIPMCTSDEPSERHERIALRVACLEAEGPSVSPTSSERTRTRWSQCEDSHVPTTSRTQLQESSNGNVDDEADQNSQQHPNSSIGRGSAGEIIESLKAKVRELQDQLNKRDQFHCLICMEPYQAPLTSIQCWHVHCEECWLRTLGGKKLCPQCNMITSPTDLRKIYL